MALSAWYDLHLAGLKEVKRGGTRQIYDSNRHPFCVVVCEADCRFELDNWSKFKEFQCVTADCPKVQERPRERR